jgi:hypothetical protein
MDLRMSTVPLMAWSSILVRTFEAVAGANKQLLAVCGPAERTRYQSTTALTSSIKHFRVLPASLVTEQLSVNPDNLKDWDDAQREQVQKQVKTYLDGLFHLHRTSTVPRLRRREADAHTTLLTNAFGERACGGIFVDSIDGYVNAT